MDKETVKELLLSRAKNLYVRDNKERVGKKYYLYVTFDGLVIMLMGTFVAYIVWFFQPTFPLLLFMGVLSYLFVQYNPISESVRK